MPLTVALAQLSPVLLDRTATTQKICTAIAEAGAKGAALICFGESLLPGYPCWLSLTNGAAFEDAVQKDIHARYLQAAVCIEQGDLDEVCASAKASGIAVYLGIVERPLDRGGHSLYCSLVYIDAEGSIQSVHRKLQPTYEERLSWSPGDGHGLVTHSLGDFTVGGLNCWENWMPLARAGLYAQGENLHVAVWPGAVRNTSDLTPILAKEGRSYVMSVCGVLHRDEVPTDFPHRERLMAAAPEVIHDGGTCLAAPDGTWLIEPMGEGQEGLFYAELEHASILRERQNFDPSGHYARPDITQLTIDRRRQSVLRVLSD